MNNHTPAAESGSQALLLRRDWKWLAGTGAVYMVLVVASVLALHPYFAQTWDAVTFVKAGRSVFSPDWLLLYAQSRADNYWPYAYPPLHAFVVAPFVMLAGPLPDWLLVRVPPLLFDFALGVLLYAIVGARTRDKTAARIALLVWLLNPVTWYDTAVQGHFEAEWLFFVVLGYILYERQRGWVWATLALSTAFLFKQNAVLFVLPLWAHLFWAGDHKNLLRRLVPVAASVVWFVIPIAVVSLPFLLASNDYLYMNVQYVADVPLQTQSWLVALANLVGADHLLLRLSSVLTVAAAAVISFFGARRTMSVWLLGTLIVLSFFLLSKKVVGYYYVMLLPFALVTLVPVKRFRLLTVIVAAVAFISLSPYFASWANQDHGWLYSILGLVNSALWLGLFVWLWREHPDAVQFAQNARALVFFTTALFFAGVSSALVQPWIASATSPIRAPLIAPGTEAHVFWVFLAFAALVTVGIACAYWIASRTAREQPVPYGIFALVVLLAPLWFLTFSLTKESTAALEALLKALGI